METEPDFEKLVDLPDDPPITKKARKRLREMDKAAQRRDKKTARKTAKRNRLDEHIREIVHEEIVFAALRHERGED